MQIRKDNLANGYYYHVFSRSIAKYVVFNNSKEYQRMQDILFLYRFSNLDYKYSQFTDLDLKLQQDIIKNLQKDNSFLVEIVAYCLMPTHIHLLLRQIVDNGISKYMSKVLNSYSRYFNIKHKRIGPLWSGRFKSVLVTKDEQLLHLTRYIHLNPISSNLVKKLEEWRYSSYSEYTNRKIQPKLCQFKHIIDMSPSEYKKFVLDRKSYQREINSIKNELIDNYTG